MPEREQDAELDVREVGVTALPRPEVSEPRDAGEQQPQVVATLSALVPLSTPVQARRSPAARRRRRRSPGYARPNTRGASHVTTGRDRPTHTQEVHDVHEQAYGGASPTPTQLSRYLRTASDADLGRRRWVLGLSLLGAGIGQVVGAYQTGLLRHLPDPPVGPFDSDRVDASDYAYARAQTPDGVLMLLTYALTAWSAAAGGQDRAEHRPWLPLLMAAKTGSDVATNWKLFGEEWRTNKALCAWCLAANLASNASLVLTLPEAGRALRRLRSL